ncbi:hypothetical protein CANARDRAFT_9716 [[Candida] arabinofermentans NRRL YB-2248]|uniref:glutathione-specific gamma-glutamylcyclotransferase n=1 Tax=[Candida] arabinofermentans NRRL YB-2248 TaxID=983967 RepID=A0A1E4SUY0_9ASCO|nr:hypothetical protein CANARDRAFT_9716 [[Candida] arabinofermentans NRRL YB-2248]
MTQNDTPQPLWVVGYGSLIFKPPLHDVPFSSTFVKYPGYINGFIRRFWQSSYDNRGTPENKGRVVTIISSDDIIENESFKADILKYELNHLSSQDQQKVIGDKELLSKTLKVYGCIYYIPAEYAALASEYLDLREKDGYTTHEIEFHVTGKRLGNVDSEDEIWESLESNGQEGGKLVKSTVYIGTIDNESFIGPESLMDTAKVIKTSAGDSGPNDEYLLELHKGLKTLSTGKSHSTKDLYLDDLVQCLEHL